VARISPLSVTSRGEALGNKMTVADDAERSGHEGSPCGAEREGFNRLFESSIIRLINLY
jgi:hypothetical protein